MTNGTDNVGSQLRRSAQHDGSDLPGTDMKDWLDKKRAEGNKPHALEGSEGEVRIHLYDGVQTAWQHKSGQWMSIPIEEALVHAGDKFGGAR